MFLQQAQQRFLQSESEVCLLYQFSEEMIHVHSKNVSCLCQTIWMLKPETDLFLNNVCSLHIYVCSGQAILYNEIKLRWMKILYLFQREIVLLQ